MVDNIKEVTIQRPKSLEEFIGQEQIKRNLEVYISSINIQGKRSLDHIMLYGEPGKGKTSLAMLISTILKGRLRVINGTSIQKLIDITNLLGTILEGDIIFIDEIHRINKNIEEMLYSAMEDYNLSIMVGKGPQAKNINIPLKPFTIIGATTKYGLLSQPLRNRFGITFRFEDYNTKEMMKILHNFAIKNKIDIKENGAYEIAIRSKNTPRIGLNLCKRILDFMYAAKETSIHKDLVIDGAEKMGIDHEGLETIDRRYLEIFKPKIPIGLNTISGHLGETEETIEEVIEPYLMKINFIERTPKGRIITDKGLKHLNNVKMLQT